MPYELAKTVRQGQEPYTVLKAPADYAQAEGAKLEAGVTSYRALAGATGCQQFVFGWDTNFTIGYLLSQPQAAASRRSNPQKAPAHQPHGGFLYSGPSSYGGFSQPCRSL